MKKRNDIVNHYQKLREEQEQERLNNLPKTIYGLYGLKGPLNEAVVSPGTRRSQAFLANDDIVRAASPGFELGMLPRAVAEFQSQAIQAPTSLVNIIAGEVSGAVGRAREIFTTSSAYHDYLRSQAGLVHPAKSSERALYIKQLNEEISNMSMRGLEAHHRGMFSSIVNIANQLPVEAVRNVANANIFDNATKQQVRAGEVFPQLNTITNVGEASDFIYRSTLPTILEEGVRTGRKGGNLANEVQVLSEAAINSIYTFQPVYETKQGNKVVKKEGQFPTYAASQMKARQLEEIRANSQHNNVVSLEDPFSLITNYNDEGEEIDTLDVLDRSGPALGGYSSTVAPERPYGPHIADLLNTFERGAAGLGNPDDPTLDTIYQGALQRISDIGKFNPEDAKNIALRYSAGLSHLTHQQRLDFAEYMESGGSFSLPGYGAFTGRFNPVLETEAESDGAEWMRVVKSMINGSYWRTEDGQEIAGIDARLQTGSYIRKSQLEQLGDNPIARQLGPNEFFSADIRRRAQIPAGEMDQWTQFNMRPQDVDGAIAMYKWERANRGEDAVKPTIHGGGDISTPVELVREAEDYLRPEAENSYVEISDPLTAFEAEVQAQNNRLASPVTMDQQIAIEQAKVASGQQGALMAIELGHTAPVAAANDPSAQRLAAKRQSRKAAAEAAALQNGTVGDTGTMIVSSRGRTALERNRERMKAAAYEEARHDYFYNTMMPPEAQAAITGKSQKSRNRQIDAWAMKNLDLDNARRELWVQGWDKNSPIPDDALLNQSVPEHLRFAALEKRTRLLNAQKETMVFDPSDDDDTADVNFNTPAIVDNWEMDRPMEKGVRYKTTTVVPANAKVEAARTNEYVLTPEGLVPANEVNGALAPLSQAADPVMNRMEMIEMAEMQNERVFPGEESEVEKEQRLTEWREKVNDPQAEENSNFLEATRLVDKTGDTMLGKFASNFFRGKGFDFRKNGKKPIGQFLSMAFWQVGKNIKALGKTGRIFGEKKSELGRSMTVLNNGKWDTVTPIPEDDEEIKNLVAQLENGKSPEELIAEGYLPADVKELAEIVNPDLEARYGLSIGEDVPTPQTEKIMQHKEKIDVIKAKIESLKNPDTPVSEDVGNLQFHLNERGSRLNKAISRLTGNVALGSKAEDLLRNNIVNRHNSDIGNGGQPPVNNNTTAAPVEDPDEPKPAVNATSPLEAAVTKVQEAKANVGAGNSNNAIYDFPLGVNELTYEQAAQLRPFTRHPEDAGNVDLRNSLEIREGDIWARTTGNFVASDTGDGMEWVNMDASTHTFRKDGSMERDATGTPWAIPVGSEYDRGAGTVYDRTGKVRASVNASDLNRWEIARYKEERLAANAKAKVNELGFPEWISDVHRENQSMTRTFGSDLVPGKKRFEQYSNQIISRQPMADLWAAGESKRRGDGTVVSPERYSGVVENLYSELGELDWNKVSREQVTSRILKRIPEMSQDPHGLTNMVNQAALDYGDSRFVPERDPETGAVQYQEINWNEPIDAGEVIPGLNTTRSMLADRIVNRGGTMTVQEERLMQDRQCVQLSTEIPARLNMEGVSRNIFNRGKQTPIGTVVHDTNAAGDNLISIQKDGQVVADNGDITKAVGMVSSATKQALSQPAYGSPEEVVATIRSRIQKALKNEEDNLKKAFEAAGQSPIDAESNTKRIQQITKTAVDAVINHVSDAVGGIVGVDQEKSWHIQGKNIPIKTAEDASALSAERPEFAAKFQERYGKTPLQYVQDSKGNDMAEVFMEDGADNFAVGGGGWGVTNGGKRGGFGNRFWGGRWGAAFYSAYLGKRLYGMTVGPEVANAEAYAKGMEDIGISAGEGASGVGGAGARLSLIKDAQQRSSYEVYGGLLEAGAMFDTPGGGINRMMSYGKAAAGVAMTTSIAEGVLPQIMPKLFAEGGSMAGMLGKVGSGGLIAGGLMMGIGGAFEMYNAFHPGEDPISPASVMADATARSFAAGQYRLVNGKDAYNNRFQSYGWSANVGTTYGANLNENVAPSDDQWLDDMFNEDGLLIDEYKFDKQGRALTASQVNQIQSLHDTPNQKQIGEWGNLLAGISPQDMGKTKSIVAQIVGKVGFSNVNDNLIKSIGVTANKNGVTSETITGEALQYADAYAVPGTEEYVQRMEQFSSGATDAAARSRMTTMAGRDAGYAAQIQAMLPNAPQFSDIGKLANQSYGITSQKSAAGAMGLQAAADKWIGELTPTQENALLYMNDRLGGSFAKQLGAQFMSLGVSAGFDVEALSQFGSSMIGPMSPQQQTYLQSFLTGDMQGMSWAAWMAEENGGMSSPMTKFFTPSGENILNRSGQRGYEFAKSWQGVNPLLDKAMSGMNFNSSRDWAVSMLRPGASDREINAFMEGGPLGLSRDFAQQSYDLSMASAGISFAGVQLQRNFNWGVGGSWDNPQSGSMYWFQDRQREMSYHSQQADFRAQDWQMNFNNDFSMSMENLQSQRMDVTQGYNLWNIGFNRQNQLQSREWVQQSWQYQDQTNNLNWAWSMEDIDLAIRQSSGRQRRQLETQKERMTTSHNLQGEQIDEQRSQQEKTWQQEDERYKKSLDYTKELIRLDKETFDLNKKHREESFEFETKEFARKKKEYEEQFKMETEITALQRKYASDQLDLQAASAGIQAAQAQLQKDQLDDQKNIEDNWNNMWGTMENVVKNEQAANFITALSGLMAVSTGEKSVVIDKMTSFIKVVGDIKTGGLEALIRILTNNLFHTP